MAVRSVEGVFYRGSRSAATSAAVAAAEPVAADCGTPAGRRGCVPARVDRGPAAGGRGRPVRGRGGAGARPPGQERRRRSRRGCSAAGPRKRRRLGVRLGRRPADFSALSRPRRPRRPPADFATSSTSRQRRRFFHVMRYTGWVEKVNCCTVIDNYFKS